MFMGLRPTSLGIRENETLRFLHTLLITLANKLHPNFFLTRVKDTPWPFTGITLLKPDKFARFQGHLTFNSM